MMNGEHFRTAAITYLNEGVTRIGTCLSLLNDAEVWEDPAPQVVSVGNLVKHLSGNLSQYILKGLGARAYERRRDEEFSTKPGEPCARLETEIRQTVNAACEVIAGASDAALARTYKIQGFEHTGTSVIVHAVEHFSYHVGQITLIVKLKGRVPDYYAGQNLNVQ